MQVAVERIRRQITRFNFARIIRPIWASGDRTQCAATCSKYAVDEMEAARVNPLRGPDSRNVNFRSGGVTFGERFNRLFGFLGSICMGICNRLPRKLSLYTIL